MLRKEQDGFQAGEVIEVSILVVMESAQEAFPKHSEILTQVGFNPCCNGKCSGRKKIRG